MNTQHNVIEILRRYDRPGPRYTSYPPAPLFSNTYTTQDFLADIRLNNEGSPAPLSLYVHIPFCDTLCYFCGCTTYVTRDRGKIQRYLDALKLEIDAIAQLMNPARRVVQMAWGGGTPSYLTPHEIWELATHLQQYFPLEADTEFSVEIDPRDLLFDHIKVFRRVGVNRVSIGVQDFDESVQRSVHRVQPEHLTVQAIEWARAVGINSINLDLIYGLPKQTPESFSKTLEKIIRLSPDRIAVFNLAYVPWLKPAQKLLRVEDLPSPEIKLKLLVLAIEMLEEAGYVYIGMDHFAKPDDELAIAQRRKMLHRNFQGYSTRAGADLYSFGLSAISHFGSTYAQNAKTLPEYQDAIMDRRLATHLGYRMSRDDEIRKHVIMRLMCDLEVDKNEVERRFGIRFDEYFSESINQLTEFTDIGLVRDSPERLEVTGAGRLLLRNIAMCFDAYVQRFQDKQQIFSRTV